MLFAGIFVTMVPALAILNSWGQGRARGARPRLRHDRAVAVLLGDRRAVELPGQRPHLPDVRRHGGRAGGVPTEGRYLADFLATAEPRAPNCWRRSPAARSSWAPTPTSATDPTSWSRRSPRKSGVRMPGFFRLHGAIRSAILIPIFVVVTFRVLSIATRRGSPTRAG